ncbi:heme-degrading domain-containing protein [Nesterenkonia flava]|uniref:Heme-degrading domain-containing protein n=1 Tax=Nesterenkonia flava TaxID=469799 RepID=A0ABU1FVF7_9MICC|nr:heme-degrading domain-containing protein [Nesterenkonia flava]MDR5712654.1 heme-degrading domain-containing protein [Nesterenkonia flava]
MERVSDYELGTPGLYDLVVSQERALVLSTFTRDDAWALGTRMREAARARSLPVVIGIVVGAQRVFHAALEGSSADNDAWLERKTRAAVHYSRSSLGVGEQFRRRGWTFEADSRLDPREIAGNGGVFPITVKGVGVVGAVGVSGLPQLEDHDFVVEMLQAHMEATATASDI